MYKEQRFWRTRKSEANTNNGEYMYHVHTMYLYSCSIFMCVCLCTLYLHRGNAVEGWDKEFATGRLQIARGY